MDQLQHDDWPCVPLPQHYDIDGRLLTCDEAKRQRSITNGLVLRGGSQRKPAPPYQQHAQ